MKISFIIVNYCSIRYLEKCFVSIIEKTKDFDSEIIVVNNDKEKIELSLGGLVYSNKVTIVEINQNIGFARASNIGVNKSEGDILCFINPDARIISENVGSLINEFVADKTVGIIGPKIVKDGKIQSWSAGVDMDIFEIIKSKFGFPRSKNFWLSRKKISVDWVSGVSLFVERKAFLKVGGFDENFFLYYEDVDLCKRIKKINKEILYFPLFEVLHLEGKSSKSKYKQKLEYFKSQDYFYKKWFSPTAYYLLKFLRFFYLLRYRINLD